MRPPQPSCDLPARRVRWRTGGGGVGVVHAAQLRLACAAGQVAHRRRGCWCGPRSPAAACLRTHTHAACLRGGSGGAQAGWRKGCWCSPEPTPPGCHSRAWHALRSGGHLLLLLLLLLLLRDVMRPAQPSPSLPVLHCGVAERGTTTPCAPPCAEHRHPPGVELHALNLERTHQAGWGRSINPLSSTGTCLQRAPRPR